MLLATANIGRKLLLSYMAMAMLVMVSALIGVSGFSLVAKTEKNVVDSAIPAMMEARQVSELSARIISSVQMLSSAKNEKERQDAGHNLFAQLELLLSHIEELGDESFDFALVKTLEKNVQNIINNLAELGISVERKLWLSKERSIFIRTKSDQCLPLLLTHSSLVDMMPVNDVNGLMMSQQPLKGAYKYNSKNL